MVQSAFMAVTNASLPPLCVASYGLTVGKSVEAVVPLTSGAPPPERPQMRSASLPPRYREHDRLCVARLMIVTKPSTEPPRLDEGPFLGKSEEDVNPATVALLTPAMETP